MITNKSRSIFVVTVVFLFGALALVGVSAQDATSGGGEDEAESITSTTATESETTREERLESIKQRRQLSVDRAREQVLTRRCEAAQLKIGNIAQNVAGKQLRRTAIYNTVADNISNILTRLNDQGIDTSGAASSLDTFNEMVLELMQAIDEFEILLDDLSTMDCTEDVTGFQAGLEEARETSSNLKTQAQELHEYLRTEVKAALESLILQLQEIVEE